jgi:hypothetical protein
VIRAIIFQDPLKVPLAQQNSEQPLSPLAMLAATSPGTGEVKKGPSVKKHEVV